MMWIVDDVGPACLARNTNSNSSAVQFPLFKFGSLVKGDQYDENITFLILDCCFLIVFFFFGR